jgi:phage repressor protein C with HTH and peptisase S24 domain
MKAVAGNPVINYLDKLEKEAKLIPHLSFRAQLFIEVEGDSMSPTLDSGEVVVISQVFPDEIIDGKVYVVHTKDGEVLIKRIVVDRAKKLYMLMSDNRYKYYPFAKEEHEIFAVFRVLGKFIALEPDL